MSMAPYQLCNNILSNSGEGYLATDAKKLKEKTNVFKKLKILSRNFEMLNC